MAGNSAPAETAEKGEVAAKVDEEAITNKEKKIYSGFIAQEVEATAKKLNYDFSGVYKPENDQDVYGLSYSDFIVPLVKAVQELNKKAERVDALEKEVVELKAVINGNTKTNTSVGLSSAYLEVNTPNPSRGSTIIHYHIPNDNSSATVAITDMKGSLVKSIILNSRGSGEVTLDTTTLADGSYNYTLYVNGRQIDSKRLVVIR